MSIFRSFEFSIDIIIKVNKYARIGGRCCKDLLKIGDCFTDIYDYTKAESLEDFGKSAEKFNVQPINLRIRNIYAYKYSLNELDPGLTAEIELEGDSFDALVVGRFLGGKTK